MELLLYLMELSLLALTTCVQKDYNTCVLSVCLSCSITTLNCEFRYELIQNNHLRPFMVPFQAEKHEAVSSASVLAFVGFAPYHYVIIT